MPIFHSFCYMYHLLLFIVTIYYANAMYITIFFCVYVRIVVMCCTLSWRLSRREAGRIGEVGPPASGVFLLHFPYSRSALNAILLCEAIRLPPPF
jgi:hypothetical protein